MNLIDYTPFANPEAVGVAASQAAHAFVGREGVGGEGIYPRRDPLGRISGHPAQGLVGGLAGPHLQHRPSIATGNAPVKRRND